MPSEPLFMTTHCFLILPPSMRTISPLVILTAYGGNGDVADAIRTSPGGYLLSSVNTPSQSTGGLATNRVQRWRMTSM